jgi:hypothetical protein
MTNESAGAKMFSGVFLAPDLTHYQNDGVFDRSAE